MPEEAEPRRCRETQSNREGGYRPAVDILDHFEPIQADKTKRGAEFDEKIYDGIILSASSAAAAQPEVAKNRQVVVPPDRLQAGTAPRVRPQQTFFERKP